MTPPPLSVHYTLTIDDMVDAAMHAAKTSRTVRGQRARAAASIMLVGVVLFALVSEWWLPIGVGVLVLLVITLWSTSAGVMRQQVLKRLSEGKNLDLMCVHEMTLHRDYFSVRSPLMAAMVRWEMVERVARDARHLFIYVSAAGALSVPLRAFDRPDDADAFFTEATARFDASRTTTPDLREPPPWEADQRVGAN